MSEGRVRSECHKAGIKGDNIGVYVQKLQKLCNFMK